MEKIKEDKKISAIRSMRKKKLKTNNAMLTTKKSRNLVQAFGYC
jgi:hypothetical protein